MGLKPVHKHRISVQKKKKKKVGPHGELRKYCKYSEPVTANSGVAVKKGAQMRLKRDVWSGEIFSLRTQQAEKRLDEVGRGWGRGQQEVKAGLRGEIPASLWSHFLNNCATQFYIHWHAQIWF